MLIYKGNPRHKCLKNLTVIDGSDLSAIVFFAVCGNNNGIKNAIVDLSKALKKNRTEVEKYKCTLIGKRYMQGHILWVHGFKSQK